MRNFKGTQNKNERTRNCSFIFFFGYIQYRGYHAKTTQALKPRRTSSTQLSSQVIQVGLPLSFSNSLFTLLGFTFSQKSGDLKLRQVVNGLSDHFPRDAYRNRRSALLSTDSVGGVRTYLLHPIIRTTGTVRKTTVGRKKDSQNPTKYSRNQPLLLISSLESLSKFTKHTFSEQVIDVWPIKQPKLINR